MVILIIDLRNFTTHRLEKFLKELLEHAQMENGFLYTEKDGKGDGMGIF